MNLARLSARLKPVFLSKKGPSKARLLTKMSSSEELGALYELKDISLISRWCGFKIAFVMFYKWHCFHKTKFKSRASPDMYHFNYRCSSSCLNLVGPGHWRDGGHWSRRRTWKWWPWQASCLLPRLHGHIGHAQVFTLTTWKGQFQFLSKKAKNYS